MMFKGYKVIFKPTKTMHDYEGLNYSAGKLFGFHPLPKPREVFVDKNMPRRIKIQTIKHEVAEVELMKKGMGYWEAHKHALKAEHVYDKIFKQKKILR